jgi:hypothetical protein
MDLVFELIKLVVAALVGGALAPILIARYSKTKPEREGERKSLDAKTESEITKAAESIASGNTITIANMLRENEYWKKEVAEARVEIDAITESRRVRDIETQKEREELKARIMADQIETDRLRGEAAQAQAQIIKLEDMAIKMGVYVDKMKTAMQDANIPVPLNGEILDSVRKLKLSVEERRRLAGGK